MWDFVDFSKYVFPFKKLSISYLVPYLRGYTFLTGTPLRFENKAKKSFQVTHEKTDPIRSAFYVYQTPPPQKLAPTMIKRINNTTIKAKPPLPQANPDIQSLLICVKEVLRWVTLCYVRDERMTHFY